MLCLMSVYGMETSFICWCKLLLAARSAFSFPLIPVWLGSQHRVIYRFWVWRKCSSSRIFRMRGCSNFLFTSACKHDFESEKIIYLEFIELLI